MKNFYLLMLGFVSTVSAFAQPYQSLFSDSTAQWNIVRFGVCDNVCTGEYTVTDTVIFDTTQYYKLSTPGMFSDSPIYIREDSLSGKVWSYNVLYNNEYLTMDLGLGLGDTFLIYDNSTSYNAIVDSIYFVNSKKHVRTNALIGFCGMNVDTLTFIEGSGTTAGFGYQGDAHAGIDEISDFLVCHSNDSSEIYQNSYFPNECFICMLGINENQFNFDIYPNPAQNFITISLTSGTLHKVEIYDLNGRKVLSFDLASQADKLKINDLENGEYIIKVLLQNGESSVKKLVIQN